MKNIVFIIALIIVVNSSFSQKSDTSRFNFRGKEIILVSKNDTGVKKKNKITKTKRYDGHWAGIEFGYNGYLNSNASLTMPSNCDYLDLNTSKSWCININLFEQNFNLIKNIFGITTGLGFGFNNYHFDRNITLVSDSSRLTYIKDTLHNFQKNKLAVNYIAVPILFEFQIPAGHEEKDINTLNNNDIDLKSSESENSIFLSFGIVGALKLSSHLKQIYKQNDKRYKNKVFEDFHLSPFKYSLTGRIGYDNIRLFVNYSLSQLFDKNQGPSLYPLEIGIGIEF